MAITDDEINQLRDWCEGKPSPVISEHPSKLFLKLLARLEAAEKIGKGFIEGKHDEALDAYDEWRKAAGK